MSKFISMLFVLFLLVTTMYAQQGNFVASEKLSPGWEFAEIYMENDWGGWVLNFPVLIDREDFSFEYFESPVKEEEKKFLYRFTYKYKNQFYEFILAVRGVISDKVVKDNEKREVVFDEQENKLNTIIKTALQRGKTGLDESLIPVKAGLYEVVSESERFIKYNSYMEDAYVIIFQFRGYHRPIRTEDSEGEVKKKIKYIMQNVDLGDHGI